MKPRLRLIQGRGMTPAALADEERMEAQAAEHETRQHAAHLRLLAKQLPLWNEQQVARMLNTLADRVERRLDSGTAA